MIFDNINPWINHYKLGSFKLAQTMRPFPKVPLFHFLDEAAARNPHGPACLYMDKKITFGELKQYIDKLTNALVALGIKKGRTVATMLPASPQFIIADFAIQKTGATHVPCEISGNSQDLLYELGESNAGLVIFLDTHLDLVKSIIGQTKIKTIIVTALDDFSAHEPETMEIPGALQLRDLMSLADPTPPRVEIDPLNDPALVLFVGKDTGKPKKVMLTHYNLTSNTLQSLAWVLDPLKKEIEGKSSMLIAISMNRSDGHWAMRCCVYWGLQMLLVPDPSDTDTIMKLLKKHRPFMASLEPIQYTRLLERKIGRMKTAFFCGSLGFPTEVSMKFKKLTGCSIIEAYGYTETGSLTHINISNLSKITGGMTLEKPGSIGVPIVDTEVKLVDSSSGEEVKTGDVGELYIKGPQVTKGYWPTSGNGLVNGWFPTKNLCRMDADGYFYLVDLR